MYKNQLIAYTINLKACWWAYTFCIVSLLCIWVNVLFEKQNMGAKWMHLTCIWNFSDFNCLLLVSPLKVSTCVQTTAICVPMSGRTDGGRCCTQVLLTSAPVLLSTPSCRKESWLKCMMTSSLYQTPFLKQTDANPFCQWDCAHWHCIHRCKAVLIFNQNVECLPSSCHTDYQFSSEVDFSLTAHVCSNNILKMDMDEDLVLERTIKCSFTPQTTDHAPSMIMVACSDWIRGIQF